MLYVYSGSHVEIDNAAEGFYIYTSTLEACEHPRDFIYMPWGYSPWVDAGPSVHGHTALSWTLLLGVVCTFIVRTARCHWQYACCVKVKKTMSASIQCVDCHFAHAYSLYSSVYASMGDYKVSQLVLKAALHLDYQNSMLNHEGTNYSTHHTRCGANVKYYTNVLDLGHDNNRNMCPWHKRSHLWCRTGFTCCFLYYVIDICITWHMSMHP